MPRWIASEDGSPSIVWFRDDLRLTDNPALRAALDRDEPIVALYLLDEESEGGAPSAEPRGGGCTGRWHPSPNGSRIGARRSCCGEGPRRRCSRRGRRGRSGRRVLEPPLRRSRTRDRRGHQREAARRRGDGGVVRGEPPLRTVDRAHAGRQAVRRLQPVLAGGAEAPGAASADARGAEGARDLGIRRLRRPRVVGAAPHEARLGRGPARDVGTRRAAAKARCGSSSTRTSATTRNTATSSPAAPPRTCPPACAGASSARTRCGTTPSSTKARGSTRRAPAASCPRSCGASSRGT